MSAAVRRPQSTRPYTSVTASLCAAQNLSRFSHILLILAFASLPLISTAPVTGPVCLQSPTDALVWVGTQCQKLTSRVLAEGLSARNRHLRASSKTAEPWSRTSLREKLIKIGAKFVSHGRYVTFQLAEVAVRRQMFQEILMLITRLRTRPAPA
jgi:hypothetical protein